MLPYIKKSFRGGISDESDKGVAGAFKFGYGLNIHERNDTLTAKQAMLTIFGSSNTTQTGIIKYFIQGHDGTTYCFGSTGSIFSRSEDGTWLFVYNDENGEIKGAAEWELDTGVSYLMWATNTCIARKPLKGADTTPDSNAARWTDATQNWKTTLDPAAYHTMAIAGGQLNIANGNFLASVEYDGDFDPAALNLRPGNLIKCLEERDDYVILGSYRDDNSEEGHIWSWINTATNWIQKKRIPIKGVNSMINTELFLLQGGSDGELFFSDFVNAVPLHGIPGGGETAPSGVSIEDDLAIFGIYGGDYPGLWSYGRKRKNRPDVLNYDYRLVGTVNGSTISTIAAVATIDGLVLASWGTTDGSTSEYGVDCVSSTTKAVALYEGLEFDNGTPNLKKFFDTIKITMKPLPTGTSISAKFKVDNESAWRYAVLGNGSTTYSEVNAIEAIFSIGKPSSVYEVGMELNPYLNTAPEILSITTYISNENYEF
jgi:hypothetical protein